MSNMPPLRDGLVTRVLDLCRLRGDPQELPYSPTLLVQMLVVATAIDGFTGSILGEGGEGLLHSLLASVVVFGLCWVALAIRGLGNRYVQTAIALAGSGIVVSLAQLPIIALIDPIVAPSPGAAAVAAGGEQEEGEGEEEWEERGADLTPGPSPARRGE